MDFLYLMSAYKYYLYEKFCTNMSAVVCELELMGSWEGTREDIIFAHHISVPSPSSSSLLLGQVGLWPDSVQLPHRGEAEQLSTVDDQKKTKPEVWQRYKQRLIKPFIHLTKPAGVFAMYENHHFVRRALSAFQPPACLERQRKESNVRNMLGWFNTTSNETKKHS